MGSIQSSTMILCALGNRSASFLSRRAHLLTTPVGRWYFRWKSCALRGGCGFFGSLMDNATALRIYCHCPRSWWNTVASADGIPPTARTNLPLHKVRPSGVADLSAVMTISIADSHFLFHKEKQKLYERMEMTKWQSIIWKPK